MLTIKYLREEKDEAIQRLSVKNFKKTELIDQIIALDDKRRATQLQLDEAQARMNQISKEIGILFKSGKHEEANILKNETGLLKEKAQSLSEIMQAIEKEKIGRAHV